MSILNDSETSPGTDFKHFVSYRKVLIPAGTSLCKFTQYDTFPGGSRGVSPWWAFEHPGPSGDRGIDAVLAEARRSDRPIAEFLRDVYAVMFAWNAMGLSQSGLLRLVLIETKVDVYGFHGPTQRVFGKAPPLKSPAQADTRFPGGAFQLYVPNLGGEHVIERRIQLLGS